jgi:hypothetical protein
VRETEFAASQFPIGGTAREEEEVASSKWLVANANQDFVHRFAFPAPLATTDLPGSGETPGPTV